MDIVKGLVGESPVVIFSRSTCDISHSIKALIRGFGANPMIYELDQIPDGQQIETALRQQVSNSYDPSVPIVFIGKEFVGGERQVMSLLVKNQLGSMLVKAGAIWNWNTK